MSNILTTLSQNNEHFARLIEVIRSIPDPRAKTVKHPFESIMIIIICASVAGANDDVYMEEYAKSNVDHLKKIIDLPYGVPSHDTINRMLGAIHPIDMHRLMNLVSIIPEQPADEVQQYLQRQICLDGKSVRALASTPYASVLLRAYSPYNRVVLNQVAVANKTNEITTIPIVLQNIQKDLPGAIVTIDAIGTQKKNTTFIVEFGGDYLLPVKKNQHALYDDLKLFLDDITTGQIVDDNITYHETTDIGHGRKEIRKCWTTSSIGWIDQKDLWCNLKTISVVETTIIKKRKITISRRYYISSLLVNAQIILALARNHWGIENKLHWPLNKTFSEHTSTARTGYAKENKAILRCLVLALLQQNKVNLSCDIKRANAAASFNFLLEVLLGEVIDLRSPLQKLADSINNFFDACIIAIASLILNIA